MLGHPVYAASLCVDEAVIRLESMKTAAVQSSVCDSTTPRGILISDILSCDLENLILWYSAFRRTTSHFSYVFNWSNCFTNVHSPIHLPTKFAFPQLILPGGRNVNELIDIRARSFIHRGCAGLETFDRTHRVGEAFFCIFGAANCVSNDPLSVGECGGDLPCGRFDVNTVSAI